jgi:hypothetical protein
MCEYHAPSAVRGPEYVKIRFAEQIELCRTLDIPAKRSKMCSHIRIKALVRQIGEIAQLQPASLSVKITSFLSDSAANRTACSMSCGES